MAEQIKPIEVIWTQEGINIYITKTGGELGWDSRDARLENIC